MKLSGTAIKKHLKQILNPACGEKNFANTADKEKTDKKRTELTLNSAAKNRFYKIKEIKGGVNIKRRLLDMGLTAGAVVFVAARAYIGGAVLISIRGVFIALRDTAAELVVLEIF